MPVSAVVGRADIVGLVGRSEGNRVRFSGGTYSAHPASLLAAKTLMSHLVEHEAQVYPYLGDLGAKIRQVMVAAFQEEGIYVWCTGHDDQVLPGSSLFMLHFPYEEAVQLNRPEDWLDPSVCDITLGHQVMDLALLLEDIFLLHSHGAISTAHTEEDLDFLGEACRRVARRIKPHL